MSFGIRTKILQTPISETQSGGTSGVSNSQPEQSSVFNDPKSPPSDNNQKVTQTIVQEQIRICDKYKCGKQLSKAENNEKILSHSKIPNLSGGYFKIEIENISKEIQALSDSISNKCANCKTEEEVKNIIKDIETEIQQKKHKADVLMQRSDMAVQLDNKLGPLYSDPEKAKLLEKIDINKITSKLTEPVEDVDTSEIENNDNINDKTKDAQIKDAFKEALKNDEITNVIKSLLKYVQKGEKDDILNDYIKDDANTQNPFSLENNSFDGKPKKLFDA